MVAIATATLNYLGCYRDYFVLSSPTDSANRILNGLVAHAPDDNPAGYDFRWNSPSNCAQFCNSHGFAVSGVEYNAECYCANPGGVSDGISRKLEVLDDDVCLGYKQYSNGQDSRCLGDGSLNCGGENAIAIYAYGITRDQLIDANSRAFAPAAQSSSASTSASASSSAASTSVASVSSTSASSVSPAITFTPIAPVVVVQPTASSSASSSTTQSSSTAASSSSSSSAFTLRPSPIFPVAPLPSVSSSSSAPSATTLQTAVAAAARRTFGVTLPVVVVVPTPILAAASSSSSSSVTSVATAARRTFGVPSVVGTTTTTTIVTRSSSSSVSGARRTFGAVI